MLRSTLIYAPAILLTRLSALLLLVIATRLIDQNEYGLLTLVVTVGELTDSALTNWLRIALLRLGGKGEISRGSLLLAARVLLVTATLGLAIAAAASLVIAPERWVEFAVAVGVYLSVAAVSRFALTILQMQQRHGTYSLLEFARAALQLALPVAAILAFQGSFLLLSLASSLGTLIAGVAALLVALQGVVPGAPRFTHRELFALGIPLIAMAVVGFGLNSAERVLLKVYYDAGAVAIFAAAYALARQPIDTVANAINMGAFPEMVSRFDQQGPAAAGQFLSRQMALMAQLSFPIAALLVALSHDIAELLLPVAYHGHVGELFPLIALAILCSNFASFVFENVFHAHKRPWLLIVTTIPGSIGTIVASLLLIPQFAAVGAALALAIGTAITLVADIVLSRRLTRVPIPWLDLVTSALVAASVGLAAWLGSELTGVAWPVVRLAVGGTAGGLVFLALQTLLHPAETRAVATHLRARLARA
ncbi:MAG: lipopolysaccharide biosynthesis protein [Devosia sp.]